MYHIADLSKFSAAAPNKLNIIMGTLMHVRTRGNIYRTMTLASRRPPYHRTIIQELHVLRHIVLFHGKPMLVNVSFLEVIIWFQVTNENNL